MLTAKDDLRDLYEELTEPEKLHLWQRFSSFLNNSEIQSCMSEVRKGEDDLFVIHKKHGFIDKYQIYFHQVIRNIFDCRS